MLLKMGGEKLGGFAFKYAFVNELIALFISKVIPRFLVSAGITGIITIGASVTRSISFSYIIFMSFIASITIYTLADKIKSRF